jgi:hypothetical protein
MAKNLHTAPAVRSIRMSRDQAVDPHRAKDFRPRPEEGRRERHEFRSIAHLRRDRFKTRWTGFSADAIDVAVPQPDAQCSTVRRLRKFRIVRYIAAGSVLTNLVLPISADRDQRQLSTPSSKGMTTTARCDTIRRHLFSTLQRGNTLHYLEFFWERGDS